jgi:hypothetical protein
MKKYLVLIGAAVLVLALASPSMAQFKSWGHLEVQTMWVEKPDLNTGATTPSVGGIITTFARTSTTSGRTDNKEGNNLNYKQIFERFRFFLQYGDPKTVRAVMGFEADSFNWGESPFSVAEQTADGGGYPPPSGGFGRMGVSNTDQVQLKIMWAFLEFVVPNTPVSARIGLQNFAIGDLLFQNMDCPGVTLTADFAPHKVQGYWWRRGDDRTLTYNVNDTYGAQWSMAQQLFNIYLYGFYTNNLYPQGGTISSDHPWWIGLGGGFRPGNWDLSAQFVYNGGTQDLVAGDDLDYAGYALQAMAKYRVGPGLAVGAELMYTSGGDADDTTEIGRYTLPGFSENWWGMGAGRSVFYYFNWDFNYVTGRQLNFTGSAFGRLNVEYNPVPWVNLNFNWLYLVDTISGTGDGVKIVNSPEGARQDTDKDSIGNELSVIAKIKIYEPLYYNIGFGYFLPGDVFNTPTRSADNGWALNSKLIYAF